MKRQSLLLGVAIAALCAIPLSAQQATGRGQQQPGPRVVSPEVFPDKKVTFRLLAPKAGAVVLNGSFDIGKDIPMTKDDQGIWSVTVGPLGEQLWWYSFMVDGVKVLDPGNGEYSRDGAKLDNWLMIPGPFSDSWEFKADVPHGAVQSVWYPSEILKQKGRRMYVYTPPDYMTSNARYPVLYLLHGGGGDEIIERAHTAGIKVMGATVMPEEGVWLANERTEGIRQTVNRWIRTKGNFDAVVDFDAAVRDPQHPAKLRAEFNSGDNIHLSDDGYQAMADAFDLSVFK